MNLLKETLEELESVGKKETDIMWVGSHDGTLALPWNDFKKLANIDYDNGYGGSEVAYDLVVVGDDWWLYRWEYDGSEGWKYQTLPMRTGATRKFSNICNSGYEYELKDMNKPKETP